MKTYPWILRVCLIGVIALTALVVVNAQGISADDAKQITLGTKALELVSVTHKAETCRDQKGVTVRLRVIGNMAVDVRRYMSMRNSWLAKDFLNQSVGNEIVDFACYEKAPFKFFTRAAGSSDEFPKP